ncbi:MAG: T9SS type A sorting domain-containing protein [Elusimicrobia bacterium]|nr:T9SS type A sorting domain-containing protein [Elusimicrobiota bacterium]
MVIKQKTTHLLIFAIFILFFLKCIEKTLEALQSKQKETMQITQKTTTNTTRPNIEWGIGVYPSHGLTNPNISDWDDAFRVGSRVGKIAHLEVTHGEMSLDDMFMLCDIKVPLAKKYDMETFIQINTFGKIPDAVEYRHEAVEVAKKYKPDYMCLGQEINYVYDDNPKEKYQQFVRDILITYQEVKNVSPNTKVFPSFAYEPMRAKHQEFLFDDFKEIVPYFTMTSYPMDFLNLYPKNTYKSPQDIPANYWNVSDITYKNVFVTETGWSTNTKWGGSRQQQAEFVDKVNEFVRANLKIRKVVWITMMDLVDEDTSDTYGYPGTMGFFTIDGIDKGNFGLITSEVQNLSVQAIIVYPNPYNPRKNVQGLTIVGLTTNAKVKIYTISGELIREIEGSDGDGSVVWDGKNGNGKIVASGIYIGYIKDTTGVKKVKIAVEK